MKHNDNKEKSPTDLAPKPFEVSHPHQSRPENNSESEFQIKREIVVIGVKYDSNFNLMYIFFFFAGKQLTPIEEPTSAIHSPKNNRTWWHFQC
jgi:hypothetical protein